MRGKDRFVGDTGDFSFDPEASGITADILLTFAKEATLGRTADESSITPITPERRRAFERIQGEVAEIQESGGVVDLPFT